MSHKSNNDVTNTEQPLYAQGAMVAHQYIAIPWTRSATEQTHFITQVEFADGSGKNHVFVVRYLQQYLNYPCWELSSPLDDKDLKVLERGNVVPTGREAVYKGLINRLNNILLVNITPVQMNSYCQMVKKCNLVRSWSPLGAKVPIGAPVVVKSSTTHGGQKSKGIFASEDITGNTMVGEYRGDVQILPSSYLFENNVSCYVLDAGEVSTGLNYFIVSDKARKSSWVRYINRPNAKEIPNVVFETYKVSIDHPKVDKEFCVLVKTIRKIRKGEQLLVAYIASPSQ